MTSRSNASKRKADAPPSDAPNRKRQAHSVTSLFHAFFIAPTNQLTTDKGKEKGSVSTLTARSNLLNLLQRTSLLENELGEHIC